MKERKVQRLVIAVLLALLVGLPGKVWSQADSVQTVIEVDITGNRNFPKSELMSVIESRESSWFSWLPWIDPTPMVSSRVRTDLLRLSDFYKSEGFLEVSVDTLIERQKNGYRVAFLVSEGDPVIVDSVEVYGLESSFLPDPRDFETVKGQRLTRVGIEDDRLLILASLRDSGYAFAEVGVKTAVHRDRRRALVEVTVDTRSRYRFGEVVVRGNHHVDGSTILRGVTFRPRMAYEQTQVREARRQLYRSGAFRSVVIAFPDSLALDLMLVTVVTVSERSLRSAKLGAGYDTQNIINGAVSWTHRSAFGGAQQFRVGLKASAILTEFRVGLTQPYVFGPRNWMNFGVFAVREEKGSGISQTEVGGNVVFERNIASRTTLFFETRGGLIDFKSDSLFSEFVTQFVDDQRDDFLDPSEGTFVRLEARQKGALLRSNRELLQFTAEGRWYSDLPFSSVLATKLFGGLILNLSENDEIPEFERFRAGGLSSVRGWPFNELGPKDAMGDPLGGKSKFEASVELRTKVGKYFGAAFFVDVGNVDPGFGAFELDRYKWAIGGGIRYLSPVGPVRLDAGRRLSDDSTALWQYHFSIGQAF